MSPTRREQRLTLVRIENEAYIDRLARLSEDRRGEVEIVDPWSAKLTSSNRAAIHLRMMESTYAGGHGINRFEQLDSVAKKIEGSRLLCWLAFWQNEPVGTSAIKVTNSGLAYVVQSGELRPGSKLSNGAIYTGELRISCLMYRRIADFLARSDRAADVFALQGDVRIGASRILPEGGSLQESARTQHTNLECELRPFLLCAPRHFFGNPVTAPQDCVVVSRRFLLRTEIQREEPLYMPAEHPDGGVTCEEIIRATFMDGLGHDPTIIHESSSIAPIECRLELAPGQDFAELHLCGRVPRDQIKRAIDIGLEKSRFVEVVIRNHPGNIAVQTTVMGMGLISLGGLPGARHGVEKLGDIPATFHYGAMGADGLSNIAPIELARDYDGTAIPNLVSRLMLEWHAAAKSMVGGPS